MPSRGLLILAVVTVIAIGVSASAIDQRYGESVLANREGGLVFPEFAHQANDVAEIEVMRPGGRFALARREDQWDNLGIGGYPATSALVGRLLGDIAALQYIEPKTGRPRLYSKLEVEDVVPGAKSTRLTMKNMVGAVLADIIVGKAKDNIAETDGSGVYVRLPGDERTWLAEGALDVRYDAAEWSDSSVVNIAPNSLMSLAIKHADGEVVALHRLKPDDRKLALTNPPAGTRIEHQHQIDYMAGLLQELSFSDARRIGTSGVESVAIIEATAQSREYLAVTLLVDEIADDGSVWVRINAQVTDDAKAPDPVKRQATRIRSKFTGWRVKLPRTVTDRLRIRLSDIVETTTRN